eukprot:UN18175
MLSSPHVYKLIRYNSGFQSILLTAVPNL